jgi:AraC-like DNA-binding protein
MSFSHRVNDYQRQVNAEKLSTRFRQALTSAKSESDWMRYFMPRRRRGAYLRRSADQLSLTLIHQQTQRRWTLTELAEQLGISRTSFAVRFSQVAGITLLDYVWRIHRACDLLQQAEHSLDEIAERVGYESGAAFSKAVKREMGITPGLYRGKQSYNVAASNAPSVKVNLLPS